MTQHTLEIVVSHRRVPTPQGRPSKVTGNLYLHPITHRAAGTREDVARKWPAALTCIDPVKETHDAAHPRNRRSGNLYLHPITHRAAGTREDVARKWPAALTCIDPVKETHDAAHPRNRRYL